MASFSSRHTCLCAGVDARGLEPVAHVCVKDRAAVAPGRDTLHRRRGAPRARERANAPRSPPALRTPLTFRAAEAAFLKTPPTHTHHARAAGVWVQETWPESTHGDSPSRLPLASRPPRTSPSATDTSTRPQSTRATSGCSSSPSCSSPRSPSSFWTGTTLDECVGLLLGCALLSRAPNTCITFVTGLRL